MTYLRAASIVAGLALSAPAMAEPITSFPQAFDPYSRTAQAITGPVILSDTRAIFGNGSGVDLKLIDPAAEGVWDFSSEETGPAQLFEVSGDPGPILQGNTICSGAPSFLVARQSQGFGSWLLELAFWEGEERPTSINSPGLCGTYNYEMDAPVEAVTPEAAAAPAPAAPEPGKWRVSQSTNPLDDSPTVLLQLQADSGQSSSGEPILFVARCRSNTTEAWIVWNDYLGDDSQDVYHEWKYVTLRIGAAPASEGRWDMSTDNEATFVPGWAGDLLKRMLAADQLVAKTTPYGENPVTAVFDTRGLNAVLPVLAETCHWRP